MSRFKVMDHFWDTVSVITGAGAQTPTEEQEKAFLLLSNFLDEAPPPLRAMPALADLLIAAYRVGKAAS